MNCRSGLMLRLNRMMRKQMTGRNSCLTIPGNCLYLNYPGLNFRNLSCFPLPMRVAASENRCPAAFPNRYSPTPEGLSAPPDHLGRCPFQECPAGHQDLHRRWRKLSPMQKSILRLPQSTRFKIHSFRGSWGTV